MLNAFFDQIYLINLEKRADRMLLAKNECDKHGINYTRIEAVDGDNFYSYKMYSEEISKQMRWNSSAAALVKTTLNILEDAMAHNYNKILILEDDVQFHPDINKFFNDRRAFIPEDWETFYFGLNHLYPYKMVNRHIARVGGGYCTHCYAINKTIMGYFYNRMKNIEKPLDHYTMYDIQSRGRSYSFVANIATQRKSYSDIAKETVFII